MKTKANNAQLFLFFRKIKLPINRVDKVLATRCTLLLVVSLVDPANHHHPHYQKQHTDCLSPHGQFRTVWQTLPLGTTAVNAIESVDRSKSALTECLSWQSACQAD